MCRLIIEQRAKRTLRANYKTFSVSKNVIFRIEISKNDLISYGEDLSHSIGFRLPDWQVYFEKFGNGFFGR